MKMHRICKIAFVALFQTSLSYSLVLEQLPRPTELTTIVPNVELDLPDSVINTEPPTNDRNISIPSLPVPSAVDNTFVNPNLPSSPVRICRDKDSESLNRCLRGVLEDIKPRLASGIPEVGLPPMDPLRLPHLSFEHGSGPVKIISQFTDVEITGLSSFNKSNFWVDTTKRRLEFDVTFPHILLAGTYQLSGNLFFVPISGVGNFWLNLGGVSSGGRGELSSLTNGTGRRVVLQKTELDLNIDSIKVHLTNLFNGDRLLGSVINNFLNENSQEVFEELRPQIGSQVGGMLTLLANRALASLPADYFDDVDTQVQAKGTGTT